MVERTEQGEKIRMTLLRLESPQPGIVLFGAYDAGGGRVNVSMSMYLYGDDTERAADSERKWRTWLGEQFPAAPG